MGFIWYIVIGIVAGFLAGKIMRGGGFGLVINLLLGILGGVLGGWVFALFGLAASGLIGSLITSTVSYHGCCFRMNLKICRLSVICRGVAFLIRRPVR